VAHPSGVGLHKAGKVARYNFSLAQSALDFES